MYTFLNGNFIKFEDAKLPISDRGLKFGDGVFEKILIYNNNAYQWNYHIERLKAGLNMLKISFDCSKLKEISQELTTLNSTSNGFIRITITRGSGSQGYLPVDCTPSVIVETMPSVNKTTSTDLFLSSYKKNSNCSTPVSVKTLQGVNSILARMEANENNCYDSILLDQNENICECSSSNIFWVKDGEIYTPSLSMDVLPGCIRHVVIKNSPYKVQEGSFHLDELGQASEVFITNVSIHVLSISKLLPANIKFEDNEISKEILRIVTEDITKASW